MFTKVMSLTLMLGVGFVAGVDSRSDDDGANEVIVETLYRFEAEPLDPPRPVVLEESASTATPEGAAARRFAAMMRGDYDAWLAGWDAPSRAWHLAKENDRGADAWRAGWRELFGGGKQVYLVDVATTPAFSIVAWEIRRADARGPVGAIGRETSFNERGVMRGRMCFISEDDGWVETNTYSAHPVFQLWRSGQERVRVVAEDEDWRRVTSGFGPPSTRDGKETR